MELKVIDVENPPNKEQNKPINSLEQDQDVKIEEERTSNNKDPIRALNL